MKWDNPLTEAILLKRYKRFLADVQIGDSVFTVHVPNTGSMQSCWEPNWKCALSKSDNPTRKMPYTLEFTHNGDSWIGVNTANANKIVGNWLKSGLIRELSAFTSITPEKKIGDSRIDFYLQDNNKNDCYLEVKSVTLKLNGVAQFPDSVSERGQKHLKELMEIRRNGSRAVIFFLVQREDVQSMIPAHSIDKKYGELLKEAHAAGVEIFVYQCRMDLSGISFGGPLPFKLE